MQASLTSRTLNREMICIISSCGTLKLAYTSIWLRGGLSNAMFRKNIHILSHVQGYSDIINMFIFNSALNMVLENKKNQGKYHQ